MKIQIYNHNFDLTEPFRQYLQEKFDTLDKYQEDILNFKVELTRDQHRHKGEVFTVEVHVTMPHKQNLMVKEIQSDARAAVDLVQDKLARQLVKFKNKNVSKARRAARLLKSFKFWGKT